ncbi:hypothetical protein HDE_06609 [Halotydeus destructor]|nr:hypothetical protein HDE_06609 [Halotydeus destructor]
MSAIDTTSLDHQTCNCSDDECQLSYQFDDDSDPGQNIGEKETIPSEQISISNSKWRTPKQRLWQRMDWMIKGRYDKIRKMNVKTKKLNKNFKKRQCLRHIVPLDQLLQLTIARGLHLADDVDGE